MPHDASSAAQKETALAAWLVAHGRVAIGFSGGVDSAYLAVIARQTLGADGVLAIIGRSASYPAAQWAAARRVADEFGVPVLELDTEELGALTASGDFPTPQSWWTYLDTFAQRLAAPIAVTMPAGTASR